MKLVKAKVAHLVEHDLAKVGVAGSSPVFRSKKLSQLRELLLFTDILFLFVNLKNQL